MLLLLPVLALAGDLVIHASVPAEIRVDGQIVAQLFDASELRIPVQTGLHEVVIYRSGNPQPLTVEVRKGLDTTLTVGKAGITSGQALERLPTVEGKVEVEFRADDAEGVTLILGETRHKLGPGEVLKTELDAGDTPLSVRSIDGTVVWARGNLALRSGPVVVELKPGRLPEVPSLGGRFEPKLD